MNALKYFLGTGFYSGRFPKAPGTAGSFVFLIPLYFILPLNSVFLNFAAVVIPSALCLWVSPYFEEHFKKDPGMLVLDEWAGLALSFMTITFAGDAQNQMLVFFIGFV